MENKTLLKSLFYLFIMFIKNIEELGLRSKQLQKSINEIVRIREKKLREEKEGRGIDGKICMYMYINIKKTS